MILPLVLIALILTALWMTVYAYKQAKVDIFSPVVIASVNLMVFYVLDVLYAAWDSMSHPWFELSGRIFAYDEDSLTLAAFVVATFVGGWVVGDIFGGRIVGRRSTRVVHGGLKFDRRGMWMAGSVAFALLIGAFFLLLRHIQDLGGLDFYWTNLGARALFFADTSILFAFVQLAIMFGAIVGAYMLLSNSGCMKQGALPLIFLAGVMLLGLVFVAGLLTGARASIIKALFILAFMRHVFVARYRPTLKLALILILVASASVFYGYQIRDHTEDMGHNLLGSVFNTVEASHGNNLFIIAEEQLGGFAQGETLLSGSVSFMPRAVLDLWDIEKGEGGNAVFTSLVWPSRWAQSQSEVALGILGEIYLNFGLAVVPVLAILLGATYKAAYEMFARARASHFWLVLNVSVSWSIFQLLRGDLYNTINNFVIFAAACVLFYASLSLGKWLTIVAGRPVGRPALIEAERRRS